VTPRDPCEPIKAVLTSSMPRSSSLAVEKLSECSKNCWYKRVKVVRNPFESTSLKVKTVQCTCPSVDGLSCSHLDGTESLRQPLRKSSWTTVLNPRLKDGKTS
jgi:hypothetical protein